MPFLRKYLEQRDTRYQQPTQPCALQGGSMRSGLYFYSLSRLKVCSLFVAVRAKKTPPRRRYKTIFSHYLMITKTNS